MFDRIEADDYEQVVFCHHRATGLRAIVAVHSTALGPALGGWIFDTFGRYTWMYVGSAAIGLGAVAIALAFPPFPRAARAALPAAA